MAEIKTLERPPLSAWQVESLRMTAFPSPAAQIEAEPRWWTYLVGEPSETQVTQRKQGIRREEGSFANGRLLLTIQPSRVDWLYRAEDDAESDREGPAMIGPLPESLMTFSQLMTRWLESRECPVTQRLAFGATLWQPVDDRQTGYRQLAAYLPGLQLSLEGATDFLYQINRARNSCSAIAGLRINRLSKWSVSFWAIAELPLVPETRLRVRQKGTGCRLELDINTHPDFPDDLPQDQLGQIFNELVTLGQEIAREGDIP